MRTSTGSVPAVSSAIEPCWTSCPWLRMTTRSATSSHLVELVARHQHRASLAGEVPQQAAQPADAVRVEAVRRLVEDEDARVAEQRGGQAEPLPHAHRVAAHLALGRRRAARPCSSTSSARCSGSPATAHMIRRWLRAVRAGWKLDDSSAAPTYRDGVPRCRYGTPPIVACAGRRADQPEHHPQRRRLARAVRAEEAGDRARLDGEAEPVDRADLAAEDLGELVDDDASPIRRRGLARFGHSAIPARPDLCPVTGCCDSRGTIR